MQSADLITSDDVDDDHEISCSGDAAEAFELKDIGIESGIGIGIGIGCKLVSISPVTDESHWEVANRHNHVSQEHPSPHGDLGRSSGLGGESGLNLQNHVVSCIRECYNP